MDSPGSELSIQKIEAAPQLIHAVLVCRKIVFKPGQNLSGYNSRCTSLFQALEKIEAQPGVVQPQQHLIPLSRGKVCQSVDTIRAAAGETQEIHDALCQKSPHFREPAEIPGE
jgi:hypothetical protein